MGYMILCVKATTIAWRRQMLFVLLVLVSVTGNACSGNDSGPATPTSATGTSTPLATASLTSAPSATATPINPSEAFRQFARSLAVPLNQKDAGFFRSRLQTRQVVCTILDVGRMGEGLGCQRVGQEFDGVLFSFWRSDRGDYVTVDQAIAAIESLWLKAVPGVSDQFGDSMARPYAVTFPDPSLPPETPKLYTVVLTAIHDQPIGNFQTAPRRATLLMFWQLVDGQWRLWGLMNAFGYSGSLDFLEPTQDGRQYMNMNSWERLGP
jgi:hypothetical protein